MFLFLCKLGARFFFSPELLVFYQSLTCLVLVKYFWFFCASLASWRDEEKVWDGIFQWKLMETMNTGTWKMWYGAVAGTNCSSSTLGKVHGHTDGLSCAWAPSCLTTYTNASASQTKKCLRIKRMHSTPVVQLCIQLQPCSKNCSTLYFLETWECLCGNLLNSLVDILWFAKHLWTWH